MKMKGEGVQREPPTEILAGDRHMLRGHPGEQEECHWLVP